MNQPPIPPQYNVVTNILTKKHNQFSSMSKRKFDFILQTRIVIVKILNLYIIFMFNATCQQTCFCVLWKGIRAFSSFQTVPWLGLQAKDSVPLTNNLRVRTQPFKNPTILGWPITLTNWVLRFNPLVSLLGRGTYINCCLSMLGDCEYIAKSERRTILKKHSWLLYMWQDQTSIVFFYFHFFQFKETLFHPNNFGNTQPEF